MLDDAAIGVFAIGLHIGILPQQVVGRKLKDVGVHLKDEQVIRHLQLRLELATVAVLEPHTAVELPLQGVVHLGRHLQQHLFQQIEDGERMVVDLLFQIRFTNDRLQYRRPQRSVFHIFDLYNYQLSRNSWPSESTASGRMRFIRSIDRLRTA